MNINAAVARVRYVNTYSGTHLYLFLILQEFTTTTCFGPICGPSPGCGWIYSLGYTVIPRLTSDPANEFFG